MSNSKNFSLIVPAAADKQELQGRIPHVFTFGEDGLMLCVKSITGLNLDAFDAIYFTILKKHKEAFDIDTLLSLQIKRLGLKNAKIVILDNSTNSQAETIAKTIEKENLSGSIFIKDADCYFNAEILLENGVAVYPLEKLELVDPRNKSYVSVDDMHYITNIIEKKVVSHFFNAGGYCFEDVKYFLTTYQKLKSNNGLYLSHIVYSMLLDGEIFRPISVNDYSDWNI